LAKRETSNIKKKKKKNKWDVEGASLRIHQGGGEGVLSGRKT